MGLVEAKLKILEKLWENQEPMRAKEVAQKLNLGIPATTMHLLNLKKWGYVYTPKHGYYALLDSAKEKIGLRKIDKGDAAKILSKMPHNRSFHFFTELNQYTNISATSLAEFCHKIQEINVKSVNFHFLRGDFENWFKGLGDIEIAKRISLISDIHLQGEQLRDKICEIVKKRLEELERILC